ncbi:enamine deaminase RidA (YjgF/YER057c/UK114 family) [Rhizobium binae]|uniref:Enamine deaminase RidA (YjgF/YER057c/UK114 family) n=1 Tax=Rhizobium binae TaxID=1138190 RepID=A0ABV2MBH9_9HYPH
MLPRHAIIQWKEPIIANSNPSKKAENHGVAWERAFGHVQAVQVKDTIYVSGQLSHDDNGNLVAPAELDEDKRRADFSQMESQIRQTYVNAKTLLARYGATLDDVVEETLYVLDVPSAFAAGYKVRKEMYGTDVPQCASNLISGFRRWLSPADRRNHVPGNHQPFR